MGNFERFPFPSNNYRMADTALTRAVVLAANTGASHVVCVSVEHGFAVFHVLLTDTWNALRIAGNAKHLAVAATAFPSGRVEVVRPFRNIKPQE